MLFVKKARELSRLFTQNLRDACPSRGLTKTQWKPGEINKTWVVFVIE